MADASATIEQVSQLRPAQVAQVLALSQAVADADGVYPFAEHVVLHVRHGGEPPAVHLLARTGSELAGYAHVDPTDEVEGPVAELAVHPSARRRGLGRQLVAAAAEVAATHDPAGRLRLWAHGDHPAARALAHALGFRRTRVLHQLRRSLFAPIAEPQLPPGVRLRAFRPGQDDQAWLTVNARAFADHPEQGRWSHRDLRLRMQEPWFDPAGFLLAERAEQLLGFHWTKVHGDGNAHHHHPIGEVYVLGVDPSAHGLGLGKALTLAGLRYLRGRGLDQVMLYVEESNPAAMALYTSLGFARWSVDVTFTRSGG